MDDPILIEVTRGGRVESAHRGAVAVVDADGRLVLGLGDIDRPVFPRSAVKIMQALPLVESGTAAAMGLTEPELALACASHSGEAVHVATAAAMLAKAGLSERDLECGVHPPLAEGERIALARGGARPSQLHNNCSGKHAGFLCCCRHGGLETRGYVRPSHALQREIRAALEDVTSVSLGDAERGVDGCAIPTYAQPLRSLARGFARLGTGTRLGPLRAAAAQTLLAACAAAPLMVAGTGRFCTAILGRLGRRAYVKTGAEGMFCGVVPGAGLGFAVKCADGGTRAAEAITASLLAALATWHDDERVVLARYAEAPLINWTGTHVGDVRASGELRSALQNVV